MAPFLDGFPYNPKDAHFLGKPVDFVVFDDKGIHFVEVKSGEAKLTDVQRRIKKDIEENRVTFEVYRISGG
jgi:predicted Holliday junction resolvase-like endonuclease